MSAAVLVIALLILAQRVGMPSADRQGAALKSGVTAELQPRLEYCPQFLALTMKITFFAGCGVIPPITPALKRLEQEDCKFKGSLDNIMRPYLHKHKRHKLCGRVVSGSACAKSWAGSQAFQTGTKYKATGTAVVVGTKVWGREERVEVLRRLWPD